MSPSPDEEILTLRRALEEERALRRALEVASGRKDDFLSQLGHELRNPLSAIHNGINLLKLGSLDSQRAAEMQELIADQMQHVLHLVDDLMDVARATRGKIALSRQPLDLVDLVMDVVEKLEGRLSRHNHQVFYSLPDGDLPVFADPTRLEQVISCILDNAIRYTPDKGRIEIALRRDNDQARLDIRDSGVGMAPELLNSAFDLFHQGDRSPGRSNGGLGIGLTLARSLTLLHGGRIHAESGGRGRGTVVHICLPLLEAPLQERPAADAQAPGGLHVLVVEDNEEVAHTLGLLIEQLGQRVTLAHSGESALEEAATERPDLVLLDIGLPGMDGYETCRQLRARFGEALPVVGLTGYAESPENEAAGFSAHYTKPLSLGNLQDIFREVGEAPAFTRD